MRTIGVLLAALALPLFAVPQAPTKYVTDAAGVLDDPREQALNERLAQYDRETTNQLLVLVFLFVVLGFQRRRRVGRRWWCERPVVTKGIGRQASGMCRPGDESRKPEA